METEEDGFLVCFLSFQNESQTWPKIMGWGKAAEEFTRGGSQRYAIGLSERVTNFTEN